MDMVTVIRMKNKLIKTIVFCSMLLFVPGCQKADKVSQDDAIEVALDDAGFEQSEVTDINASEDNGDYVVTFTTPNGSFTYTITEEGIIDGRKFSKDKPAEKDKKEEENKEEDQKAEEDKKAQEEQKKNEDAAVQEEQKNLAITLALNNAGVTEAMVSDITCEIDGNNAVVEFDYGNYHNTIRVNLAEERVTSSAVKGIDGTVPSTNTVPSTDQSQVYNPGYTY